MQKSKNSVSRRLAYGRRQDLKVQVRPDLAQVWSLLQLLIEELKAYGKVYAQADKA